MIPREWNNELEEKENKLFRQCIDFVDKQIFDTFLIRRSTKIQNKGYSTTNEGKILVG